MAKFYAKFQIANKYSELFDRAQIFKYNNNNWETFVTSTNENAHHQLNTEFSQHSQVEVVEGPTAGDD